MSITALRHTRQAPGLPSELVDALKAIVGE
jgi:hypothetical protein